MAEGDEHHSRQPLRWFTLPLEDVSETSTVEIVDSDSGTLEDIATKSTSKNPFVRARVQRTQSQQSTTKARLRRRHAPGPSELFYDLFFVANLNTFTNRHKITNGISLLTYVGFFALLWCTWFSVSLFDVRLGQDSVLDRIAKAAQLGIMVGFAMLAMSFDPNYDLDNQTFYMHLSRKMSLMLMISRWILVVQYAWTSWYARKKSSVHRPTLLLAITYTISALVLFGVSFAYTANYYRAGSIAYVAWYVTGLFEIVVNVVSSCYWVDLNFEGAYLAERMSLLTLIILGEGVMGLYESIVTAWDKGFLMESFGSTVACALLILYFLYQLYFDNVPESAVPFGAVRQQLWVILHLPLHVAMILCVEGTRLFVIWKVAVHIIATIDSTKLAVIDMTQRFFSGDGLNLTGPRNTTEYFAASATNLSTVAMEILRKWPSTSDQNSTESITAAAHVIHNGNTESAAAVYNAVVEIIVTIYSTVFRAYDIEGPTTNTTSFAAFSSASAAAAASAPETETEKLHELLNELVSFFRLYDLVLAYFFIASGCILVILGLMNVVAKSGRKRNVNTSNHGVPTFQVEPPISEIQLVSHSVDAQQHAQQHAVVQLRDSVRRLKVVDIFRFVLYFVVGLGLSLVSLMYLSAVKLKFPGEDFLESFYVLPTVTLTFFGVLLMHHLPLERLRFPRIRNIFSGRKTWEQDTTGSGVSAPPMQPFEPE